MSIGYLKPKSIQKQTEHICASNHIPSKLKVSWVCPPFFVETSLFALSAFRFSEGGFSQSRLGEAQVIDQLECARREEMKDQRKIKEIKIEEHCSLEKMKMDYEREGGEIQRRERGLVCRWHCFSFTGDLFGLFLRLRI